MIATLRDKPPIVEAIYSNDRKALDLAFRHVYSDYYPTVKGFIIRNGGTENDAYDIFQESLIVFFKQIKWQKFRGESSPKTYLFGIARNLWYKGLSSRSRNAIVFELSDQDQPEWTCLDSEPISKRCLYKLIQELLGDCGEVLLDFYFRGLSMNEIRDKHGLGSTQAAKNKKRRCLKRLINQMAERGITAEAF